MYSEENNLERKLEKRLYCDLDAIETLDLTQDERSKAIDDLVKMYKIKIESDRAAWEYGDKHRRTEFDIENKKMETKLKEEIEYIKIRRDKEDKIIRYTLEVMAIVLPLTFYGVWMRRGFEFETTGAFTSRTFQNLISKFKPTKI